MNSLVSRAISRGLLSSQSSTASRASLSGLTGQSNNSNNRDKNRSPETSEYLSQKRSEDDLLNKKDKDNLNKKDDSLLQEKGFEQEKPTSAPQGENFDSKIPRNKESREARKEHEMERTGRDPHKDFQYEEIDLDKGTGAAKYKEKGQK